LNVYPSQNNKVKEVMMNMAAEMIKAIRRCFTNASRVTDRYHVLKQAYDALQEIRINTYGKPWMLRTRRHLDHKKKAKLSAQSAFQW
jgi:transposase